MKFVFKIRRHSVAAAESESD